MKSIGLELETWGDCRIWVVRERGHEPDAEGCTDPVAEMVADKDTARILAIARGQRVGWPVVETTGDGQEVVRILWAPPDQSK